MSDLKIFVSCPHYQETLLQKELENLEIPVAKIGFAGVYLEQKLTHAYQTLLWSHLASRVLWQIAHFEMSNSEDLYQKASVIAWNQHFDVEQTLWIDFHGTNAEIKNEMFGAQRIKDAICDYFRKKTGNRPTISKEADLILDVFLHRNQCTISINLAGKSLHERGYKQEQGKASLKENLAASLLYKMNWPERAAQHEPCVDVLCGVGTFLIEAALMACHMAPGLIRESFGFEAWKQHDDALWQTLSRNAAAKQIPPHNAFYGTDANRESIDMAMRNAKRAGVGFIQFKTCTLNDVENPSSVPGLLIANPPYGVRLEEKASAEALLEKLGETLHHQFQQYECGILLEASLNGKLLQHHAEKIWPVKNGDLDCKFYKIIANEDSFYSKRVKANDLESLPDEAQMIFNRLNKNLQKLKNWIKRNDIQAYRLYHADMPEYNAAVDVYGNQAHVQEFLAPKTISLEAAEKRLNHLVAAVSQVLQVPKTQIVTKTRRRQTPEQQYRRMDLQDQKTTVREGMGQFLVNLTDYLDTGLFLDHRLLRKHIFESAQQKKVLNLFCYTGSFSVMAALGGAKKIVSVDRSHTYIRWARENFARNGLSSSEFVFLEQDCWDYVKNPKAEQFDIVICDAPTFSNSKDTPVTWDIVRDHPVFIQQLMRFVKKTGVLYFSGNAQKFKLDEEVLNQYHVEDITAQTIDLDFERAKYIHFCYRIRAL